MDDATYEPLSEEPDATGGASLEAPLYAPWAARSALMPQAAGPSRIRRTLLASWPDIAKARAQGRRLSRECGFSETQGTLIATVISELSRNILLYADEGEICLGTVERASGTGLVVNALDRGPGIAQPARAMMGGYSTSGGLGLGLCGVRRLVDDFRMDSQVGKGTRVFTTKWAA